ncbi:MFS transporter [Acrocarpospora macrocephala]|uniref:MFS transporter n=1 Tax=Acrocarpospora macrocephala TaxID=150177 RepID=A0A5M3WUP6_9ACTN|nr:MFS transporter [Acrocarpospora macrocephala]GES12604.1 MFS transporter [Acrocarpospora macrocephala]
MSDHDMDSDPSRQTLTGSPQAEDSHGEQAPDFPIIKIPEKIAYAFGDIGSNLVYAPATSFVLFYLTNVAGIGAAIAGTILLIGQLLNGFTDVTIGVLIDKTSTRWGKARPWVLWTAVPLTVSFVLLFSVPAGLGETGKIVWVLITYTLVMAVFFTASNVAYSAMLSVMTPSPKTRVTLTTFRFFSALLTTLIVNSITLPIVEALGNDQFAWTSTTLIYGIIGTFTLIVVFTGTKERVTPAQDVGDSAKQPLGLMLKTLMRNHYFFLAAGLFTAFNLMNGLSSASGVYYVTDVLGDVSLFGIVSIAGILPALIGMPFMPALMGRYTKRTMFLAGIGVMLIGSVIPLFAPENFAVVLIGLVFRGLGMVPLTAGLLAIVADVVDYGEWRNGVRTDGLIYSSVVLGQKIGSGFGTAIVGWVLAFGGYNATAEHQSEGAVQAILASFLYLPLLMIIITGVIVYFFRIERHSHEIQQFLRRRVESQPGDSTT